MKMNGDGRLPAGHIATCGFWLCDQGGGGRCGGVMATGKLNCVSRALEGIAVAFGGLLVLLFGCLWYNCSCSFILNTCFFLDRFSKFS